MDLAGQFDEAFAAAVACATEVEHFRFKSPNFILWLLRGTFAERAVPEFPNVPHWSAWRAFLDLRHAQTEETCSKFRCAFTVSVKRVLETANAYQETRVAFDRVEYATFHECAFQACSVLHELCVSFKRGIPPDIQFPNPYWRTAETYWRHVMTCLAELDAGLEAFSVPNAVPNAIGKESARARAFVLQHPEIWTDGQEPAHLQDHLDVRSALHKRNSLTAEIAADQIELNAAENSSRTVEATSGADYLNVVELVSPDSGKAFLIATDRTKTVEERVRLLQALDDRFEGYSSEKMGGLLGVTRQAVDKARRKIKSSGRE